MLKSLLPYGFPFALQSWERENFVQFLLFVNIWDFDKSVRAEASARFEFLGAGFLHTDCVF